MLRRLESLRVGRLTLFDATGTYEFGHDGSSDLTATLHVHHRRFYRSVALGGAMAAAESYIRGDWDSPDLTTAMRVLARNMDLLAQIDSGLMSLPGKAGRKGSRITSPFRAFKPLRLLRAGAHWLRRNTRAGSKRNIAAHYDLSNEFFALMLDPTMTYSSGIFDRPEMTLEQASIEKYDRICRRIDLRRGDHVLEIGTGWGGFADHAVRNYGCRVTTTTISDEQHAHAAQRFRAAGIERRIHLLRQDYRDLSGTFDKLVSIEMIEAVGESFLPGYFEKCSQLLKPEGLFCLQAITIPDHRYDSYRKSVDFIQQYIFPGGFLPSVGAMARCVGERTDFRFLQLEDFGSHYAETLARWRRNFWREIARVKALGFDKRFIRTWHYYLCYCEAGFHERQIGVAQILLSKPEFR